ncbi:MAG: hypothetical protein RB292_00125 [Patescibacteria group bacterium]|jgi:hypothetical protein|nr:hypothetical protein [Patescibacteria group bacterium]
MLVAKKLNATKKIILTVLLLATLGLAGYLVYKIFLSESFAINKPIVVDIDKLVVPKINTAMPSDFLNQSPYLDLKARSSQLPSGRVGRSNPFGKIPFDLLTN